MRNLAYEVNMNIYFIINIYENLGKIIQLVEEVGSSFGENFAAYVTDLCPYLLNVLQNDKWPERKLTLQVFGIIN